MFQIFGNLDLFEFEQEWIYCDCVTFQKTRLNLMEKKSHFFLKILNSTCPLDDLSVRFTKVGKKYRKIEKGANFQITTKIRHNLGAVYFRIVSNVTSL